MLGAVEQVYGVTFEPGEEPIRKVVPNGKTDRQIIREMLVPRGVTDAEVDAGFAELERIAAELHARSSEPTLTPDASRRAADVLTELKGEGHVLALLTGNLEPIARHKMALAGLGRLLPARAGRLRLRRRAPPRSRSPRARARANSGVALPGARHHRHRRHSAGCGGGHRGRSAIHRCGRHAPLA